MVRAALPSAGCGKRSAKEAVAVGRSLVTFFVSLVTSQALPGKRLTCDLYFGSPVTSLTHEFAACLGKSASNHL